MKTSKEKISVERTETESEVIEAFYERIHELYEYNKLKSLFILIHDDEGGYDAFSLGDICLGETREVVDDLIEQEGAIPPELLH